MQDSAHGNTTMLAVPEAAKRLGISKTGTFRLIHRGELPAVRVGARRIVVRLEDVNDYLDRQRTTNLTA